MWRDDAAGTQVTPSSALTGGATGRVVSASVLSLPSERAVMKRTVAGALAAVGGGLGLAVVNRALADRAEKLEPPLPGERRTYRWRGLDISYTEAGDPDDPDLLLVHGVNAAATSREFEPIVDRLADRFHVLAPDLPGFGCSERPPLVYSASLYESFLTEFASEHTDEAVCVAASLSSAYAVGAAADESVDFSRLVLVCPTATTVPGRRLGLRTLLRAPLVGTALFNLVASRPSIDYFAGDHGYYDADRKPEGLAEYQWQSAHRPGARYAPASFVSGYLDADLDLGSTLPELDAPTTLVWGREAEMTPLSTGRDLADATGCRLVVVDYCTLQPHAEHPGRFLEIVADETGVDLAGDDGATIAVEDASAGADDAERDESGAATESDSDSEADSEAESEAGGGDV